MYVDTLYGIKALVGLRLLHLVVRGGGITPEVENQSSFVLDVSSRSALSRQSKKGDESGNVY